MQFRNLIGTANCCYLISSYCTKHVAILEIGAIGRQVWKCHNIKCVEIPQSNNEILHHNFILPCYASTSRACLGHITVFYGKLLWKDWVISIISIILLVCQTGILFPLSILNGRCMICRFVELHIDYYLDLLIFHPLKAKKIISDKSFWNADWITQTCPCPVG